MPDRASQIDAFLKNAGWQKAKRHTLAGDLSSRKYTRLQYDTRKSCILMDADASMVPFLDMANWLLKNGFSAPEVLAAEAEDGLLLLEDFGDVSLTAHLSASPEFKAAADALCIDVLLHLREADPPPGLRASTAEELVAWTEIVDFYYPDVSPTGLKAFRDVLTAQLGKAYARPLSVSLRDFHAENVMWLPVRSGIRRFGLLDFQDAFLTHPAYDLMSYLTDARVDVNSARRKKVIQRYLEQSGDEEHAFHSAFAALSAQRNLRILGIFAKAAAEGRPHHLNKLPRVHAYLAEALEHPVFAEVREDVIRALPDPHHAMKILA